MFFIFAFSPSGSIPAVAVDRPRILGFLGFDLLAVLPVELVVARFGSLFGGTRRATSSFEAIGWFCLVIADHGM